MQKRKLVKESFLSESEDLITGSFSIGYEDDDAPFGAINFDADPNVAGDSDVYVSFGTDLFDMNVEESKETLLHLVTLVEKAEAFEKAMSRVAFGKTSVYKF